MSKIGKVIEEVAVELIVTAVGWLFCISLLIGAYKIGRFAASWFGMSDDQAMIGLLSAATFVWLYEHRNIESKFEKLCERVTRA